MSLIGAYGLSFLTILLGASLADFARPRQPGKRRWRCCCCSRLLWARRRGAAGAAIPPQMVPGVRFGIVQPDIPQREKDKSRFYARNWQRLLDLSVAPGNPTHHHLAGSGAAAVPVRPRSACAG